MSFPVKNLLDVCSVRTGKRDANHGDAGGPYPFFTCAGKPIKSPTFSFDGDAIILPGNGANVGLVIFYSGRFEAYQRTYVLSEFGCDVRYAFHHLRCFWGRANLSSQFGSATNYIRMGNFEDYKLPIPSIAEQRRIADVLDRAEALRSKRRAALAQLDSLTQSTFLEMFGDPARNTKKLPTVSLGQIGDWSSGGTPPRSQAGYFKGSIPWFSSGELNEMFVMNSEEHVSTAAISETTAKVVPKGALMLGMYDTAALKASIAGIECSCNQAIAFAALDETIVSNLYVYFAVSIGREHFRRLQRGVRQKNLNLTMVRGIEIPKPSLAAQLEFAERMVALEKLKLSQRASLTELDALFASLQHRAFRGEL